MIRNYSLKITAPCSEKFEDMLPSPEGKYCQVCEKNIIDFSQMSDYEITSFIHLNKDKPVCGMISSNQEKRKYVFVQAEKVHSPVKRYVMAILTGLMTTLPHLASANISPTFQTENTYFQPSKAIFQHDFSPKNSISGRITDKETGKPLAFVKVDLDIIQACYKCKKKGYDEKMMQMLEEKVSTFKGTVFETTTDENGFFVLNLPDNMPEMPLELEIYFQDINMKNAEGRYSYSYKAISPILLDYKAENMKVEHKAMVTVKEQNIRLGGGVMKFTEGFQV
jgi:hypothetical protein